MYVSLIVQSNLVDLPARESITFFPLNDQSFTDSFTPACVCQIVPLRFTNDLLPGN